MSCIGRDEDMPMHVHSVNYEPGHRIIAPNHSRFDSMVFHMSGHWHFTLDIYEGDQRQRLTQKISAKR